MELCLEIEKSTSTNNVDDKLPLQECAQIQAGPGRCSG